MTNLKEIEGSMVASMRTSAIWIEEINKLREKMRKRDQRYKKLLVAQEQKYKEQIDKIIIEYEKKLAEEIANAESEILELRNRLPK